MTEKIFSLWDEKRNMIAGPLERDNALLLGLAPVKPLDQLDVGEMATACKQTSFRKIESFWVRRDK